jgi:hypothetical protein
MIKTYSRENKTQWELKEELENIKEKKTDFLLRKDIVADSKSLHC